MVGVLAAISTIAQLRQPAVALDASVIRVALLTPGVAINVVSAQLPEAGLIVLSELKPVHPLCRLPEIEMRHKQARRPPVIARQRLAFIIERDHCLPCCEIRERDVCGVSVVAMCERKRSGRIKPSVSENVVDRYALPCGVEFR